uniref:Uncharacterized protein n=1 Tax=Gouania willdenowi TaxID=441366 RepID=A0A8C5GW44_GOUWI
MVRTHISTHGAWTQKHFARTHKHLWCAHIPVQTLVVRAYTQTLACTRTNTCLHTHKHLCAHTQTLVICARTNTAAYMHKQTCVPTHKHSKHLWVRAHKHSVSEINHKNSPKTTGDIAPPLPNKANTMADLKAQVLLDHKEMKEALAENFNTLKVEIQSLKTALINTAALRSDMDQVKVKVNDMEDSLSTWSDEVVALRDTVAELKTEVKGLKRKCDEMEGRMRRGNVCILGIPESELSSPVVVAKMLKEVLQLEKEPLVDRAHRSPGLKNLGGRPRVIVAKLHHQDCVEVFCRARTLAKKRVSLQTEYNIKCTQQAEFFISKSKCGYYEHGEKAGRLLAHLLRQRSAFQSIPAINNNKGFKYSDNGEINICFSTFYQSLYSSDSAAMDSDFENFFKDFNLPVVNSDLVRGTSRQLR